MLKSLTRLGALAMLCLPAGVMANTLTPATFSATIGVGETVSVNKTVTLSDSGPATSRVDVFFLADNTGSMGGILNSVKNGAGQILNAISGGDPRFAGIDVGFGVGRYLGDPREFGGSPAVRANAAYQLQQSITTSQASAQTAINGWFASGGGDGPEANFFGLHQVATSGGPTDGIGSTDVAGGLSTGADTGWRSGAGKVVVWFGDAVSHTTTVDQAEAIAALTANGVTVVGINTQSANNGIDQSGQASAITSATGGSLTNGVTGANLNATIESILAAVSDAIATIDLEFATTGDTSGLDISFTCTDAAGCTGVTPGSSRTFRMDITGTSPGYYEFDTSVVGLAGAVERDFITVTGGPVPVPEPGTLALLMVGLAGIAGARRLKA